ncbi:MAG: hypothetical protein WC792_02005 [Candidatus Micrarchaeia archaeon]|jgi:hypothetical protein
MMLDANTFKTQLTPEVAIGIIQKSLASRGWAKIEVQQIRLVYTPFYLFSFDVSPEGGQPVSGKTALNAYTGELSDFAPVLMERPLSKQKNTESQQQSEVEPSSISQGEAKEAAQAKVAAQLGVRRDSVAISAVTKFYAPAYRVWVNVAGDQFKIDVDACLGAASGMESIPAREKDWSEAAGETIEKMKSPAGWADLAGRAASGAGKASSGAKGPGQKPGLWIVLIVVIIAFFAFGLLGGGGKAAADSKCVLDKQFFEEKTVWLVSKETVIKPATNAVNKTKYVDGVCTFLNRARERAVLCQNPKILAPIGGVNLLKANNRTNAIAPPFDPTVAEKMQAISRPFRIEWEETGGAPAKYIYEDEKC